MIDEVIKPADALRLKMPSIKERRDAENHIEKINSFIRLNMAFNGCTVALDETNDVVGTLVLQAVRKAGWEVQIGRREEQPRIKGGHPRFLGYVLILMPPDAAYREIENDPIVCDA